MKRAFVLMPFREPFDSFFQKVVVPELGSAGYSVSRADSLLESRSILRDVVRGISSADLVIADLTTSNANVFYELGIAHSLLRPTILISQDIEAIPFDLRPYRVVPYSLQFDKIEGFRAKLREIAAATANGTAEFGSPVSDHLPGWHEESRLPQAAVRNTQPAEFPGLLQTFTATMLHFSQVIGATTETLRTFGTRVNAHTAAVSRLAQERGYMIYAQIAGLTRRFQTELNECAEQLVGVVPELERLTPLVGDQMRQLLSHLRANIPTEAHSGLRALIEAYRTNVETAASAIEQLTSRVGDVAVLFGAELVDPARRVSSALEAIRGTMMVARSEAEWALLMLK